ncbi:MAG: nucleotidyl transferase AbiEii/AbiGii toxin family protein [Lewinellaceae bacterium]|nr:nucleotidyl transferase AbiEii/AbiGii toxin family protein [Lewinellaceae bacterium]
MNDNTQSIQMKLKHLSKTQNRNHQLTLTRYFQERLLFRLSISKYKKNFFLKGGALIYALEAELSRPTLDLDLLAKKIKSDTLIIHNIFETVCNIEFPEDGVILMQKKLKRLK